MLPEVHTYIILIKCYGGYILLLRALPWLLAVTLVGLTQASHDLLKEQGVATRLSSLNSDDQEDIDNQQANK